MGLKGKEINYELYRNTKICKKKKEKRNKLFVKSRKLILTFSISRSWQWPVLVVIIRMRFSLPPVSLVLCFRFSYLKCYLRHRERPTGAYTRKTTSPKKIELFMAAFKLILSV
jgi:hypothetical protein